MPPRTHTLANPAIAAAAFLALASASPAQPIFPDFDSGSDGSDGALEFPDAQPGDVILFNPKLQDPPLDADNDGVFHFTTITIPEGVTVRLRADVYGPLPVYWLASGDVVIDGTLDLSGENGHPPSASERFLSVPGPGGFPGGLGRSTGGSATGGAGPGGGVPDGRGSHARSRSGGDGYGNAFIQPLLGGSGGGGDNFSSNRGGGGAGGGAILIASSTRITLDGAIDARGGDCGDNTNSCGGGSGGAVRLVAPSLLGSGSVSVIGGDDILGGAGGDASPGWIRVESWTRSGSLTFTPLTTSYTGDSNIRFAQLSPQTPLLPSELPVAVRPVSIDGQPADIPAIGNLFDPSVVVDSPGPVEIGFEAVGVPPGTALDVAVYSAEFGEFSFTSTPLEGTLDLSTATAMVEFPSGLSQFFVNARWGDTGRRDDQPGSNGGDENGDRAEGEPSNPTEPTEPDEPSD